MAVFKLSVFILFYFCTRIAFSALEPTVHSYDISHHNLITEKIAP